MEPAAAVFAVRWKRLLACSVTNFELRVLGNIVEAAVIVKQADILLNGNRGNHTVNRLPDRDAPLPKGSVNLCGTHECCLPRDWLAGEYAARAPRSARERRTHRRANRLDQKPPRFFPSAEVTSSAKNIRVYQRL